MVKKKTEDEATFPTRKELDNPPPPPKRDVGERQYVGGEPFVKLETEAGWDGMTHMVERERTLPMEASAEAQATMALNKAKQILEHIGHFETNQALVSIDAALEWLKKCEGQRS